MENDSRMLGWKRPVTPSLHAKHRPLDLQGRERNGLLRSSLPVVLLRAAGSLPAMLSSAFKETRRISVLATAAVNPQRLPPG